MKKRNLFTLTLAIQAALFAPQLLAQTDTDQAGAEQEAGDIEEVIVTGSQIRGAAINDALSVSVVDVQAIEDFGIESGEELLDALPEQGQNFFSEAENISGGVNAARGDVGAFNLRNIGTGNTLVLFNGRRAVNSATYQTEEVGGSFVPVNTANSAAIPVFGLQRVEVLRDGASAIYGADAVAGVVNTVMKNDYDGLSIRGRFTSYDNISRDDYSGTVEWGDLFNEGRTSVGVFVNFYHRDRVSAQEDPRWADADKRHLLSEDSPWYDEFQGDSSNSNWGQFNLVKSMSGDPYGLKALNIVDSSGEFNTYPFDDERCDHPDSYVIADNVCGHRDRTGFRQYRYNLNESRDLVSDLDRFNSYAYLNHEFDNGMEAYTEFSWYESSSNLNRHPSYSFTHIRHRVSKDHYYNPLGPCGSPNRLSDDIIGTEVPCEGLEMIIDNYRYVEAPRIVDVDAKSYRFLQGLRGTIGDNWDFDTAILYSKAERSDVTHNRQSNNLLREALSDPTPAAYNPWGAGVNTNVERILVDVRRDSETDLALVDFKISNGSLFDVWGGSVGFLAGAEYREESFKDDRDPRLDGTITYTDWEGDTYPFISDVVNSSPTPDNQGSRDVTSLFTEFAIPLLDSLDLQVALRYENFSDVGSTTVPKIAFGWRPTEWFMLRGSWSEAFRAPNLITINEQIVVRNNTRTDWVCQYLKDTVGDPDEVLDSDCRYTMQREATGSKDLEPEKSDNYSIGMVLTPIPQLTMTIDFWKIDKQDTIGLFGEDNHTLLDLVFRVENGLANCDSFTGNPVLERGDIDEDVAPLFLEAGLCPTGDVDRVSERYLNMDPRTVEGFDFGVYYDLQTDIGDWGFSWQGSIYTRFYQEPGLLAQFIDAAQTAGTIPSNYPLDGYYDLLRKDGQQEEKMNARLNWHRNDWGAALSWFYLSDFYQSALTLEDGTRWEISSHSTFNAYVDYRFDVFNSNTRVRLGVRNLTNERAPLADRSFGYFADAHSDLGRSYYLDVRMAW